MALAQPASKSAAHLGPLPAVDDPIIQWNPPERLAPVGCWLVILVDGKPTHAERTGFIEYKNREMSYRLESGEVINGRFKWTTP